MSYYIIYMLTKCHTFLICFHLMYYYNNKQLYIIQYSNTIINVYYNKNIIIIQVKMSYRHTVIKASRARNNF